MKFPKYLQYINMKYRAIELQLGCNSSWIFLCLIFQCKNLSFTDDPGEQERKKEEEKANTTEKVGNLITFNGRSRESVR